MEPYRVVAATDDPIDGYFILDHQGNNCVNKLILKFIPEAHASNPNIIVLNKFTADILVRRANLKDE